MWYMLHRSPQADSDFALVAAELLQSTSRNIMLAMGGLYLIWCLIAPFIWAAHLIPIVLLITPIVFVATTIGVWTLNRQYLAAQAIWQIGVTAAVAIAISIFQQPAIGFIYVLFPLVNVVTTGWPAGLAAEGMVIAVAWWLCYGSSVPSLPPAYGLAIACGGAVTGLLGWVSTRALLVVTEWSLFSSARARQKMEEAREQQLELREMQKDLLHANRELAALSERLKAMHQIAEEARRAEEEFVANVSHELRTPLNMIIGFSEMITQSPHVYGAKLPPALLADVTIIQRSSQHLAKLVDDVLDLGQVEAGRLALSKEWTSLREITDVAVAAVRALFESKRLSLDIEVPPDLPPVFCDSTRISQVILNLLSNAGRYTEQGGVRVKAWHDQDAIVVSVTDTGPGIALENQARVFEPFQQLGNSIRHHHGGRGLGLSICKRFVEIHGGRIWLESTLGAGTTISFSLPLETPLSHMSARGDWRRWFSPHDQYEGHGGRKRVPAPTMAPRYVLLEEGDVLRRLCNRYMRDTEVVAVSSSGEAIRELGRSPARALIVNAPGPGQALTTSGELTDLPYGTPTMSCWVPGADEAARRLGVVRYLVKPVAGDTLLSTLESLGQNVKKVLLVDDEPEVLQLFSRVLSSAPRRYDLLMARNGQRALDMLRQRRPDVMLLDLSMPGLDGSNVLLEKGRDASIRQIPVVVVSSTDPAAKPIVIDRLMVTRSGGLSVGDLLACIQSVSEILSPSAQPADQGRPEEPGG
jgi:signal transduction histidine kinase/CheY-like chemotaxis protein